MLKIQVKNPTPGLPSAAVWIVERLYSLGSAPDNNLVLKAPSVSPCHAKLITLDKRLYLKDNGSACGSFVNGQQVEKQEVVPGDVIRLGNVEIHIMDPRESLSQDALSDEELAKQWSLVASGSWLTGQEFYLTKSPSVLGRGGECDLVLPSTHISRRHAEISLEGNLLHVTDLASANGTYINGARVTQGIARAGDEIRFDDFAFRVVSPEDDSDKTKVRPVVTPTTPRKPIKPSDLPPKQWQTKPTSPGNRIEEIPPPTRSPWALVGTGSLLLGLVVVGYVLYDIVG